MSAIIYNFYYFWLFTNIFSLSTTVTLLVSALSDYQATSKTDWNGDYRGLEKCYFWDAFESVFPFAPVVVAFAFSAEVPIRKLKITAPSWLQKSRLINLLLEFENFSIIPILALLDATTLLRCAIPRISLLMCLNIRIVIFIHNVFKLLLFLLIAIQPIRRSLTVLSSHFLPMLTIFIRPRNLLLKLVIAFTGIWGELATTHWGEQHFYDYKFIIVNGS